MQAVSLDWGSADVRDGKLTVGLTGDLPKGWKRSFEATVTLLGAGEWEEVKIRSAKVHVTGVDPGTEDKLRHFLEGVVQQANADLDASEEKSQDEEETEESEDRSADDPDAQMTERFRSFGGG